MSIYTPNTCDKMIQLVLLIISSTIGPYLRRECLKSLSDGDFQLFLSGGILFLNVIYTIQKKEVGNVYFDRWMFFSVVNTFLSSHILNNILVKESVTSYIPVLSPVVIISSVMIDTLYLQTVVLSTKKMCGILFIIIGLCIYI